MSTYKIKSENEETMEGVKSEGNEIGMWTPVGLPMQNKVLCGKDLQ